MTITDEMRERALDLAKSIALDYDVAYGIITDMASDIFDALLAQDRLARAEERERCAKLKVSLPETLPAFDEDDGAASGFFLGYGAAIDAYRAALRAQGEK